MHTRYGYACAIAMAGAVFVLLSLAGCSTADHIGAGAGGAPASSSVSATTSQSSSSVSSASSSTGSGGHGGGAQGSSATTGGATASSQASASASVSSSASGMPDAGTPMVPLGCIKYPGEFGQLMCNDPKNTMVECVVPGPQATGCMDVGGVGPDKHLYCCPPGTCIPNTQAQACVAKCGYADDGCGESYTCLNGCPGTEVCDPNSGCYCPSEGQPDATWCPAHAVECGPTTDPCTMQARDCGNCPAGKACSAGTCVCAPKTQMQACTDVGLDCGKVSDGCAGTYDCGTCQPPYYFCNVDGQHPNQCGCTKWPTDADFCAAHAYQCGFNIIDPCIGAFRQCGFCPFMNQQCVNNKCVP